MGLIQSIIGSAVNTVIVPSQSISASVLNSHPSITLGIYRRDYNTGYFADNVNWFATETPSYTSTDNYVNIGDSLNTPIDVNEYSIQWTGYFIAPTTGTYLFSTTSDDASYMWIGAEAISGFTTSNAIVDNGSLHGDNTVISGKVKLLAGKAYPVRFQFGENGGGATMYARYSIDNGNTWIYFLDESNNSQFKYLSAYTEGFSPFVNAVALLALDGSSYSGTGNTWTDSISSLNFTLMSSPSWSNTNGGQFSFGGEGSGQYAESSTSLPYLESFTVQSVFNFDNYPNNGIVQPIITDKLGNNAINFVQGHINVGEDSLDIRGGFFASGSFKTCNNVFTVSTGSWYDYITTFDNTTKELNTYANGVLIESVTVSGTPSYSGAGIRIARKWDDSEYGYLVATIKAINIWNGVLTPSEVSQQHVPYNSLT